MKKYELKNDLRFIKHYRQVVAWMLEYWDEYNEWSMTKEEAEERIVGCDKIIAEIERRLNDERHGQGGDTGDTPESQRV